MQSFTSWLQQLDFGFVLEYGLIIAASLLCIMFHEVSHGLTALKLGDSTARDAGRLTFNPIKHVDIFGLLMMAIFRFGWAKPVPISMRNFKHPVRDMAITAAAGPLSNVVLAFLALCVRAALLYFSLQNGSEVLNILVTFFEYVAVLSVGLAVFNVTLLPREIYYKILRYERYGFIVMIVVLYLGVLNAPLSFCRNALMNGLMRISSFPFYLLQHFFG